MSGNLNQSVRRTITNTPPIVSLMKSSPKAHIPANKKKKYYPGVFFKTASKKTKICSPLCFRLYYLCFLNRNKRICP